MKTLNFFLVAIAFFVLSCSSADESNANKATQTTITGDTPGKITFDEVFHDFGELDEGEVVSYTFEFKNEGKSTLLVKQVRPSCGCTSPQYTREPVQPGESGKIQVQFDTSNFHGKQNKSVTVITNGEPSDVVLHFSATVKE